MIWTSAVRCVAVLIICFVSLAAQTPKPSVSHFPGDESNQPFKPFRIIDNIYYVGTNDLACYLIVTSDGLILLDTGLEESASIVRANIKTLGFNLRDIKIMLSSHAHFDHVGGQADMKSATGAQVYASAADAVLLESGGTKSFHPLKPFKPVKVDHIVRDGETVRLGNVGLTAHLVPGHTEGNTAWTTVASAAGKQYDVVFIGSMSINPGVHLVNFAAWPNIADVYAKSFQILKGLDCDVFLGPHASFFAMEAKARRLKSDPNAFIDPEGYRNCIARFESLYKDQLEREQKEPAAGKPQ